MIVLILIGWVLSGFLSAALLLEIFMSKLDACIPEKSPFIWHKLEIKSVMLLSLGGPLTVVAVLMFLSVAALAEWLED